MTTVDEAQTLISQNIPVFAAVRCPLHRAGGTVLRQDVYSDRDQPPFDRVTMDGIAIAYEQWAQGRRSFTSLGVQAAGQAAYALDAPESCVEVMTGSLLPLGADTVIPVERIRCDGDVRTVHADAQITAGQFIHRRGSDRPAGSHVLSPGTHIGPAEIAVLANAGCAEVSVARIPRVAVISTGNELVDVGQPVADFQIRSTNDYAIECSLSKRNLALVERVRLHDEPESMQSAIETLYTNNDALILTGGVSMGQFDFVPAVLDKLGVRKVFHRIEQRPGRPMWFGIGPLGKPVFALPGNPVSTLVCLTRYVCPALRQGLGAPAEAPEWVRLNAPVERSPTLSYFVPVRVVSGPDGTAYATAQTTNTSGDFMSLLGTDGFVELAPGHEPWPAGRPAQLFRW